MHWLRCKAAPVHPGTPRRKGPAWALRLLAAGGREMAAGLDQASSSGSSALAWRAARTSAFLAFAQRDSTLGPVQRSAVWQYRRSECR